MAWDRSNGNIYVADLDNNRIRRIDAATGIITTVAGSGGTGTFAGDGGLATNAKLFSPHGVAADAAGNVYIADTSNYRIRKVTPAGIITTVAGNGNLTIPGFNPLGDGGPATSGNHQRTLGCRLGRRRKSVHQRLAGRADSQGGCGDGDHHHDRRNGYRWFFGRRRACDQRSIRTPQGMAVDGQGNVYFADTQNNRIRKIEAPPLGPPAIRTTNSVLPSFLGAAGLSFEYVCGDLRIEFLERVAHLGRQRFLGSQRTDATRGRQRDGE
ncbi:MAG: hypothetical protein WDO18_03010 [Acidobacteriota bacterium]